MIRFTATVQRFDKMGEKTGWTYIIVPAQLAVQLNPASKKAMRVKGFLDQLEISAVALMPMGEGQYILPLNAAMRKATGKTRGMKLKVQLEMDQQDKPLSKELLECLEDDPAALAFFNTLGRGHQRYFSNWVSSARTAPTQAMRIAHCLEYLAMQKDFGTMIRSLRAQKSKE